MFDPQPKIILAGKSEGAPEVHSLVWKRHPWDNYNPCHKAGFYEKVMRKKVISNPVAYQKPYV